MKKMGERIKKKEEKKEKTEHGSRGGACYQVAARLPNLFLFSF
jgi:hypothetical protein